MLITSPTQLRTGVEVAIDTVNRTFSLNTTSPDVNFTSNLSNDGVTLQALYSYFKEEWKNDPALIPFPFPMIAITPEQFEFVSDWEPTDDTTRKLIRTGGWAEVDASGNHKREFVSVITLGNIDSGDFAYYAFESDTAKTDFTFDGAVNEPVKIFESGVGGFDKRNEVLSLFIRVQGKTYDKITTTAIGISSITYKVERFPLSESIDSNITVTDAVIASQAPYTNMSLSYLDLPVSKQMGTGSPSFDFSVVVNGATGTSQQVYEYLQYKLRQDSDINDVAGGVPVNGLLADEMAEFIGDRLDTLLVHNPATSVPGGVFIEEINELFINDVRYVDDAGVYQKFAYVAAGIINFSDTLQADPDAVYRMFFTTTPQDPGGDFGSDSAITVLDADGVEIAGSVTGRTSVAFSFDYDWNEQGTRTRGTDANVTVVAIGLNSAQYVLAEGSIARSTSNVITLVSALERNYTT